MAKRRGLGNHSEREYARQLRARAAIAHSQTPRAYDKAAFAARVKALAAECPRGFVSANYDPFTGKKFTVPACVRTTVRKTVIVKCSSKKPRGGCKWTKSTAHRGRR